MSNEKLAEALEMARNGLRWYQDRYPNEVNGCDDEAMATIDAALQAHAAETAQTRDTMTPRELAKRIGRGENWKMVDEPAQAQPQSGEWVQKAIVDAKGDIEYVHVRIFNAMKARAEEAEAMFAAATQQPAEPVAWFTDDHLADRSATTYDLSVAERWRTKGWPVTPLYTHPQPAQDASKYQELLMAVEKKFPGESRHETALRYIRQAELRSCEPKCDSSMAKESGNG